MKPQKLDVSTDYRLALLWLMAQLESARKSQVITAFEEAFGDLIPAEHREANESGYIKWEHYVAWARLGLVSAGLMGSGGRGVWTITQAGKDWLLDNPNADSADLTALMRQGSAEREPSFQWQGKQYTISKQNLLSQARRLLKEGPPPEALRFKDWAVLVGGQPVSVKWLFSLATGADYNQFNASTARRALSQIGIKAQPVGKQPFDAVPPGRRSRRTRTAADLSARDDSQPHVILEEQTVQIRRFLQGRADRPSDEVLCDWVQFCYTFELFAEGYELFNLIIPSEVNDWLYSRTRRLAQVCHIRAQNKG